MSRRLLVAAALVVFGVLHARPASAQMSVTNVRLDLLPMVARVAAPAPTFAASTNPFSSSARTATVKPSAGSLVLPALYATTFGLQMMDVRSTLTAFSHGAVEGNPFMGGIVKNTAAFVAFKAGIAMGAILSAHHMAAHNKIRAVITLAAVNSAYAMVVAHNYKLATTLGR